jgi:hypothetical protein
MPFRALRRAQGKLVALWHLLIEFNKSQHCQIYISLKKQYLTGSKYLTHWLVLLQSHRVSGAENGPAQAGLKLSALQ